jgi:hypothetical protein
MTIQKYNDTLTPLVCIPAKAGIHGYCGFLVFAALARNAKEAQRYFCEHLRFGSGQGTKFFFGPGYDKI